jgi:hypothetical protein
MNSARMACSSVGGCRIISLATPFDRSLPWMSDTPDFRYTISLQHTKKDLIRLASLDPNEE